MVKLMNWLVWYEMNAMEVCEMDHEFDSKEMVMYVGMSDCCKGKQQTHSPQIDAVLSVSDAPNSIRVGAAEALRAIAAAVANMPSVLLKEKNHELSETSCALRIA